MQTGMITTRLLPPVCSPDYDLEQALILANDHDPYLASILVYVAGVAFFATPHRSSTSASWGDFLNTSLKTGAVSTNINTLLTKDLERESKALERISKTFTIYGKSLNIYSFYETEMMNHTNCKVGLDRFYRRWTTKVLTLHEGS